MSIEQQLERLLSAVSTLADVSEQNTRGLATVRESVGLLANIAEQHQQSIEQHQRNFDTVVARMEEMQSEIRGLQTENRRILDRLFGSDSDQG